MGWKTGQGIGANPGITEPITPPPGTTGTAGLGTKNKKVAPRKKIQDRRAAYKVTRYEGELIYGKYSPASHTFSVHTLTTNGRPQPTGTLLTIAPEYVADTIWWGNSIAGPAITTFPHPQGWTLAGPDCTLEKASVRQLTLALRLLRPVAPTCTKVWTRKLGSIDWIAVGRRYRERLLTPKDFMTHFKLILHRALLTRNRNKHRIARCATRCRLCHGTVETIDHLPSCPKLAGIWNYFLALLPPELVPGSDYNYRRLILLGITDLPLPDSLSDLHLVIWKFVLIHFTAVDLANRPFLPLAVWDGAIRRYASKVNSLTYQVHNSIARAEATEQDPDLRSFNT